jgi:alpha-mannosidase
LVLGGAEDYSGPFRHENYPAELITAWNKAAPDLQLRMATPSEYLDAILPPVRAGQYKIPTVTSGSAIYGWTSFWINMPIVKQWYRRAEHGLQAAEALAAIATHTDSAAYPSQEFANAWLLMALNMDRNILWGVAVDGSFRESESWDTCDRFDYVDSIVSASNEAAFGNLVKPDRDAVTLFNPVNWARKGPVELTLPRGRVVAGVDCQFLEDSRTVLVRMPLQSVGLAAGKLEWAASLPPAKTALPEVVETPRYSARLDATTGALVSLKVKPSGREMLGGPANVVLAEEKGGPHDVPEKAKRKLVASSSQFTPFITVTTGKLATIIEMRSRFYGGGELRRVIRFYNESPRIDFLTETNGLPEGTVLSVEFPLADDITEMRRGIPYGFSRGDCVNGVPGVTGLTKGILPAIRWSDYSFRSGGGLAILDRGVTGRELVGKTAILLLHNVCETYYKFPATWMGDQRKQAYSYAVLPHAGPWDEADIPQLAWEYNSPPITAAGRLESAPKSFVETSENVIVEAMRCDADQIELRLVECLGKAGQAWAKVHLPHTAAAVTDLLGRMAEVLPPGPRYEFAVRPQQIVTIRLHAGQTVPPVAALKSLDTVVPQGKRAYMRGARNPKLTGHPPKAPQ